MNAEEIAARDRVAEKLRVMTETMQDIHRVSHQDRDKLAGDMLATGRRLERINTEAKIALIACDSFEA